jgi:predicted XRE-type DNA-binding protein
MYKQLLMRSWMTTREVRAALGVSQPRVSQLVKQGEIIASKDASGEMQYDRESVEAYATERAMRKTRSAEEKEAKRAQREEASHRFERARKLARAREEERTRKLDELRERSVEALESIAQVLHNFDLPRRSY